RHRLGPELPRRPRLSRPGFSPENKKPAEDRRRLDLLHPRLDTGDRRGFSDRHSGIRPRLRRPVGHRRPRLEGLSMAFAVEAVPSDGPLERRLATPVGGLRFFWLGQAGFLIEGAERRLLIDPYLSDSLAQKYRGTATPHERLMPPQITVEALPPLDLVF